MNGSTPRSFLHTLLGMAPGGKFALAQSSCLRDRPEVTGEDGGRPTGPSPGGQGGAHKGAERLEGEGAEPPHPPRGDGFNREAAVCAQVNLHLGLVASH